MNLSGIEREGDLMYQFNGMIEKEQAFGLELYETPFRGYDPQIGRFWQVEPLADEFHSISMFQFGFNNPISANDPTGLRTVFTMTGPQNTDNWFPDSGGTMGPGSGGGGSSGSAGGGYSYDEKTGGYRNANGKQVDWSEVRSYLSRSGLLRNLNVKYGVRSRGGDINTTSEGQGLETEYVQQAINLAVLSLGEYITENSGMAILVAFPDQNPSIPSNQKAAQAAESVFGDGDGKFQVGHAGIIIIDANGKSNYFDFGRYTRPDIKQKRGKNQGAVRSSKNYSNLRIPDWDSNKSSRENVTAMLTSLHKSSIFKNYGKIMGSLAKGLNYKAMLSYARGAETRGYLPFGGYSCGYDLNSCGSYCAKFARAVGAAGGINWSWNTFTGKANVESVSSMYSSNIIILPKPEFIINIFCR